MLAQSTAGAGSASGAVASCFVDAAAQHVSVDVVAGHQVGVELLVLVCDDCATDAGWLGPGDLGEVADYFAAAKHQAKLVNRRDI